MLQSDLFSCYCLMRTMIIYSVLSDLQPASSSDMVVESEGPTDGKLDDEESEAEMEEEEQEEDGMEEEDQAEVCTWIE